MTHEILREEKNNWGAMWRQEYTKEMNRKDAIYIDSMRVNNEKKVLVVAADSDG